MTKSVAWHEVEPTSLFISQTYSPESEHLAKKSSSELEALSLITEQSELEKISFLSLNHLMVNGGVPETRTLNWTFDPGETFNESGFSRTHGGSVRVKDNGSDCHNCQQYYLILSQFVHQQHLHLGGVCVVCRHWHVSFCHVTRHN